MIKGKINKIIDLSVVDGPGNRTSIFFQGCNFDCFYCHNPETINHCLHCFDCVPTCPSGALKIVNGKVTWDMDRCIHCDTCIKVCSHQASPKISHLTVQEVVDRIKRNLPFIKGITTSGGECTLQHKFLVELFKETKKLGLTNFVDTNGSLDLEKLPQLVDTADQFMLDIKATSNDDHLKITMRKNDTVLKNAVYLARQGKLFEIRTVTIQGMNNEKTVDEITKLLSPYLNIQNIRYKIIKYRPFGVRDKYVKFRAPDEEAMEQLKLIAIKNGFHDVVIV